MKVCNKFAIEFSKLHVVRTYDRLTEFKRVNKRDGIKSNSLPNST